MGDRQGTTLAALRPNGSLETTSNFCTKDAYGATGYGGCGTGLNTETGYAGASTPNATGGFVYMRNRWYDPQSGRFLTQDPIGLAGGVNLYAYAGGNPVSFSDPWGLDTVGFANDEARAAYQRLRMATENSTRSRDPRVAAAARRLLHRLNELEADEQVVTVEVGDFEEEGFGVSNDKPGQFGILIDRGVHDGAAQQIRLTHELGHAYNAMIDGVNPSTQASRGPSNARALETENWHRRMWGCRPRITHARGLKANEFFPPCN